MEAAADGRKGEEGGEYTIAVVGGGGVGKSTLIRRFIRVAQERERRLRNPCATDDEKKDEPAGRKVGNDDYDSCYDPTLRDEYTVRLNLSHRRSCLVTFIDTAGQEQYVEARREAMSSAQGFLLVYDITQRMSFEECEGFVDDICRAKNKDSRDLPVMVIGNKDDRPEDRQVSMEDLESFANDIGSPYRELTATRGDSVEEALRALIDIVDVHMSEGKEGTLVFTPSTVNRWSKYWFVLKNDELKYYKSTKDVFSSKAKGIIKLTGMIEVKKGQKETGREESFIMVTSKGTFYFEAGSRQERDDWLDTLRRHARAEMMKKFNFPYEEATESTEPRIEAKHPVPNNSEDEEPNNEKEIETFTIAVLGGGGVGKSSLITRFLKDDFYGEDIADPTLQDEYTGRITIGGCERVVTFIDTAGQEQYIEARREAIASAQGFLIVYDVTQRMSFDECEGFVDDVCRVKNKDPKELSILVMGNKNDREEAKKVRHQEMQKRFPKLKPHHLKVSTGTLSQFASSLGCPWREVCAASGNGIKESLWALIELISYDLSSGKEGCLWLSTGSNPRWKKHWFVLRRDELRYYRNTKDVLLSKLAGVIKLEGMIEVRKVRDEVKREDSLMMVTPQGTFFFSAQSKNEMRKWLNVLRRHVQAIGIRKFNLTVDSNKGKNKQREHFTELKSGGWIKDRAKTLIQSAADKVEEHQDPSTMDGKDYQPTSPTSRRLETLDDKKRGSTGKMLRMFFRTSLVNLKSAADQDGSLEGSKQFSSDSLSGSGSENERSPQASPKSSRLGRRNTRSFGRKAGSSFVAPSARMDSEDRPRSLSISPSSPPRSSEVNAELMSASATAVPLSPKRQKASEAKNQEPTDDQWKQIFSKPERNVDSAKGKKSKKSTKEEKKEKAIHETTSPGAKAKKKSSKQPKKSERGESSSAIKGKTKKAIPL